MDPHAAAPVVPVTKPSPTAAPPRRKPVLFPAALARPSILFWVWLVPQAVLIGLNLDAWSLASGDTSPDEAHMARTIFAAELLLFALGAALVAWHGWKQAPLSRAVGTGLLLTASIYLAVVFSNAGTVIPASLRDWILPPDQWIQKQFALVMPGALFGAFRTVCPDRENQRAGRIGLSPLAIFGVFGICFMLLMALPSAAPDRLAGFVIPPVYLAASTLLAAIVLRLCVSIYVASRRTSPLALGMFTAIVAVVLPLAGLFLNAGIPFPVDFQSPTIYALAIANGVVLCLPNFANPVVRRGVWLLQCACLPFSLYFFAVFLPFLPLMPIALLVMGLGILIAVPSALFILHVYRLLDGWRMEPRDHARWIPAMLGLAAIAAAPAFLTARVLLDRKALHGALDYLTYPDYSCAETFTGDRSAVHSALLRMRDFKEGRYLPFYSEFYNALAFDRLVLPQDRLEETWRAFTGTSLPASSQTGMAAGFFSRSRPRNAQEVLSGPVGERPGALAVTSSVKTLSTTEAGRVRVLAKIGIHNPAGQVTEYRTVLRIPDGVLVTGMWLTIGEDRVPARVFEQRAAEWVYQKITEVRPVPRDPAILRFLGPNTADLRVYPVEPRAGRLVEIEFSYPENLAPAITLDGRPLELPPASDPNARLSAEGTAAWLSAAALRQIPALTREVQPHLLVDTSRDSGLADPAQLRTAIHHALDAFPQARTAHVSFVNLGIRAFRNGAAIPVEELRALDPADLLREAGDFEGGFLLSRAIPYALFQSAMPDHATRWRPMIVALRGSDFSPIEGSSETLEEFARLAPDVDGYWTTPAGGSLKWTPFPGRIGATGEQVRVLRLGETVAVLAADTDTAFVQSPTPGTLEAWDPRTSGFQAVPTKATAGFPDTTEAARLARSRILEPSKTALARLVEAAKQANVLVPGVAFMVVENSSQWKMLERTEKKAMNGHDAMTLSEKPAEAVPEPSTLLLLVLAAAAIAGWKWRRIALSRARDATS